MWELYFEGEGIERKRSAGQSKAQTWSLIQFGTIPLFLVSGPLCSLLRIRDLSCYSLESLWDSWLCMLMFLLT